MIRVEEKGKEDKWVIKKKRFFFSKTINKDVEVPNQ